MALSHSPKIITDGLVLCLDAANPRSYPGSGTIWKDLSVNGNDGALINGVGHNADNKGTMVFDGVNDYIDCGNIGVSFGGIHVWIYLNNPIMASSSHMSLLGYGNAPQSQISFGNSTGYGIDETISILQFTGVGTQYFRTYIKDYIPSGWINLTIQWESTNFGFYINGLRKTTYNGTQGQALQAPMNNFKLGATAGGGGVLFSGKITDCKIYNRALSESEIKQNFEATRDRYGI